LIDLQILARNYVPLITLSNFLEKLRFRHSMKELEVQNLQPLQALADV